MPRPKTKPPKVRSRAAAIRLREDEWAGLKHLAETLGQPPSRVIRRLIREAITGGPDYFNDGVSELERMISELAAIGRNLNQLTRSANQGRAVSGDDVRRVVNAGIVQMEVVKGLYKRAVRATVKRVVLPLYEEAGMSVRLGEGGHGPVGGGLPE